MALCPKRQVVEFALCTTSGQDSVPDRIGGFLQGQRSWPCIKLLAAKGDHLAQLKAKLNDWCGHVRLV
jgi:hypothetical protein